MLGRRLIDRYHRSPRTALATSRLLVGMLALAIGVSPAAAQSLFGDDTVSVAFDSVAGRAGDFDLRREPTVRERRHPEYDPAPVKLGSFTMLVKAGDRLSYDSNIFADDRNRQSDMINMLTGVIEARSDWSRHQLRAYAQGQRVDYLNNSDQSYDLFGFGAGGRFDASSAVNVQAGGQYGRNVLSRSSGRSSIVSQNQILYDQLTGFVGAAYGARDLHVSGQMHYVGQRFRDGITSPGGFEQYDDLDTLRWRARADYSVAGTTTIFLEGTISENRYKNVASVQPARDSNNREVVIGSRMEISPLWRGEISVGRIEQDFRSSIYRDIDDVAYHAGLSFLPSRLLTFEARADRSVTDSAIISAGAFVSNAYQLRADYEMRRNIIVSAAADYATDVLRGGDLRYKRYVARLGARYRPSRALGVDAGYEFTKRDADGSFPARQFDAHRLSVALSYRF